MKKKNQKIKEYKNTDMAPADTCLLEKLTESLLLVTADLPCNKDEIEKIRKNTKKMIESLSPQNTVQIMLASQMIATHELQQKTAAFAKHAKHLRQINELSRSSAKLSNTFIQQATALNKLQGKNQQKMTVEHVSIHSGAQAVVGDVIHTTERKTK